MSAIYLEGVLAHPVCILHVDECTFVSNLITSVNYLAAAEQ